MSTERPQSDIPGVRAVQQGARWYWTTRLAGRDLYRPLTEQGKQELAALRAQRGLTVAQAAQLAGVSRPTIYAGIKDGRLTEPLTEAQLVTFQRLAQGRPRKEQRQ